MSPSLLLPGSRVDLPLPRVMPIHAQQISQLRAARGYEAVNAMHREYDRLVGSGACGTCALRVTLLHAGLTGAQVERVFAGEVVPATEIEVSA